MTADPKVISNPERIPEIDVKAAPKIRYSELLASKPPAAEIRDIFKPFEAAPSEKEPEPVKEAPPAAEKPAPVLRLKGVIVGGKKPLAIINDQFVGRGDRIGDFRVVSIGSNIVRLDSGEQKIVLEMVTHE